MSKGFTRIKLPSFEMFKSTRQDVSPYERFHYWVAAQVGGKVKDKKINVSASWLHPEDMIRLDGRARSWIRRTYKHHSEGWQTQALSFHRLDVSPANWNKKDVPEGVEPGYVYVNKKDLYQG